MNFLLIYFFKAGVAAAFGAPIGKLHFYKSKRLKV